MKETGLKIANWFLEHKIFGILVLIFCVSIGYAQYKQECEMNELKNQSEEVTKKVDDYSHENEVINAKLDLLIHMVKSPCADERRGL